MSNYANVVKYIQKTYKVGETFTPRDISASGLFWNVLRDEFLNIFKTMVSNNITKISTNKTLPTFNPYDEVYTLGDVAPAVSTLNPVLTSVTVPLVVKEPDPVLKAIDEKDKNAIKVVLNDVTNKIGTLYAMLENLNTTNHFDLTKVSKADLIEELLKRI